MLSQLAVELEGQILQSGVASLLDENYLGEGVGWGVAPLGDGGWLGSCRRWSRWREWRMRRLLKAKPAVFILSFHHCFALADFLKVKTAGAGLDRIVRRVHRSKAHSLCSQ